MSRYRLLDALSTSTNLYPKLQIGGYSLVPSTNLALGSRINPLRVNITSCVLLTCSSPEAIFKLCSRFLPVHKPPNSAPSFKAPGCLNCAEDTRHCHQLWLKYVECSQELSTNGQSHNRVQTFFISSFSPFKQSSQSVSEERHFGGPLEAPLRRSYEYEVRGKDQGGFLVDFSNSRIKLFVSISDDSSSKPKISHCLIEIRNLNMGSGQNDPLHPFENHNNGPIDAS